jgi:hypothetical protein
MTELLLNRKSLARVKSEVIAMDVRIGVVEHTLLQVSNNLTSILHGIY